MNYTIKNRPEFMTTKYGVEGFFVETLDLICAWASLTCSPSRRTDPFAIPIVVSFGKFAGCFIWKGT